MFLLFSQSLLGVQWDLLQMGAGCAALTKAEAIHPRSCGPTPKWDEGARWQVGGLEVLSRPEALGRHRLAASGSPEALGRLEVLEKWEATDSHGHSTQSWTCDTAEGMEEGV